MQLFTTHRGRNDFIKLILKIIIALALIQILRAAIMGGLWYIIHPGNNIALFQIINGLSFLLVGLILLLYFKPSLKELGLNWNDIKFRTRIMYVAGITLLIFMVITPFTFSWELNILITGLLFGIISPAFEEFLFRGYIWGKIEDFPEMANRGVLIWIIVTLLFSIWHLGYIDVFLIHPMKIDNLPLLMASKLMIGLILGLIVGFVRLKTQKTYGSFILHGLWNVMAP
ncbi:MAG TPA: CPBP family intramembrane glutamic endopeptidase [Methanobacteriaceae archaeon]|nr:CPBP family intramembrane glutamic endopeptidase [Methanobacteriaceae archaeon]